MRLQIQSVAMVDLVLPGDSNRLRYGVIGNTQGFDPWITGSSPVTVVGNALSHFHFFLLYFDSPHGL